jgi:flagellar biosynthesis component FlhA
MRKLSEKEKLMLKSAIRHFVLVALPVWQVSNGDIRAFGYALAAAIIGPALRGIDKNDPAWGKVAAWLETDLKKKATKKTK